MDKKVGDKRKFSNDDRLYQIREILDNPGVRMVWKWNTGVCPNCKCKLTNEFNHTFHRIEIMGTDGIATENLTRDDITIMGDTTDNKRLILTIEKYNEVFALSQLFKHLVVVEEPENVN